MQYFMMRVANFNPLKLRYFCTKIKSFCAHWTGNFLNFSKLIQLLYVAHFWGPLEALEHKRAFFLGHPVYIYVWNGVENSILLFLRPSLRDSVKKYKLQEHQKFFVLVQFSASANLENNENRRSTYFGLGTQGCQYRMTLNYALMLFNDLKCLFKEVNDTSTSHH